METDLNAAISCSMDLWSRLLFIRTLPSMICLVNNVTCPQCMEWWSRLPSLYWLVHVTTTDIEQLSKHVNLGKRVTTVNRVWLPGNSCLKFSVDFALESLFLFEDGDAWDCVSFDSSGCLWWWLLLPQNTVLDEYEVSSGWQLTSPSVRSDTALKCSQNWLT